MRTKFWYARVYSDGGEWCARACSAVPFIVRSPLYIKSEYIFGPKAQYGLSKPRRGDLAVVRSALDELHIIITEFEHTNLTDTDKVIDVLKCVSSTTALSPL